MKTTLQKTVLLFIATFLLNPTFSQNFGTALRFDGINDHVKVPNNSNYLEPANFTIETWVKKGRINSPWGKDRIMLSIAGNGWGIGFNGDNKIFFTKVGVSEVGMNTAIADTLWHHIAVTHNGTTTNFYLDGQLESSKANTTSFSSNGMYSIASRGNNENFQGEIDEIRIWNVIRSLTDIQNNMCVPPAGNETGLIAYYNFNDAGGDSLADVTQNNNNGGLTNMDTTACWITSEVPCIMGIFPDKSSRQSLSVYPNPFSATAVLSVKEMETNLTLCLYDMLGNELIKSMVTKQETILERGRLANGIYFLQLKSDDKVISTQKIVMQ